MCTKNPDADEKSAANYSRVLAVLNEQHEQEKLMEKQLEEEEASDEEIK